MNPTQTDAWQQLARLATAKTDSHLRDLLQDKARNQQLTGHIAGCFFDFSKQRVDAEVISALFELAADTNVAAYAKDMFNGAIINRSEDRAVLHTVLRGSKNEHTASQAAAVADVNKRMYAIAEQLRSGAWRGYTGKPIQDVVHIGIGGSHLGPELVVNALCDDATGRMRIHFVANIDSNDLLKCLAGLNPETTLFIVASKSWSTLETKVNANSARTWFLERTNSVAGIASHFIGVTTNIEAALAFGLARDNLLPMWDWVGGRFSLWSAVGLPILLSIGEEKFKAFLNGANAVDQHFYNQSFTNTTTQPDAANIPLLSALLATWNYNFLGASSLAVLSYDERLRLLPEYLQQLEMESNGKSITHDGELVDYKTMPVLWGGVGTRGQHAYHQLLHQGTSSYTADFIVIAQDNNQMQEHHRWLLANALGQSQAMAMGSADSPGADAHKHVAGNHPSTTIVLDELGPRQLGALLATYEHKVLCQGAIWNINSFDQWGVEIGKRLATPIYEHLADADSDMTAQDPATQRLISSLRQSQS